MVFSSTSCDPYAPEMEESGLKDGRPPKAGLDRSEPDWRNSQELMSFKSAPGYKLTTLAERHHGRSHLLEHLIASSSRKERDKSKKEKDREKERRNGLGLAMGYEVMEIRDEGDEGRLNEWMSEGVTETE